MTGFLLALLLAPARAAGFKWRGVIEGYYGAPWTWEQRGRMADWMGRRGMNLLVIAPKDDDLQRKDWRKPLPREYLDSLAALQERAKKDGVTLAWSLSPLGVKPFDTTELAAAVDKYRSVLKLGVRELVVAFDDMDADDGQVGFANRLLRVLSEEHPDVELTFVPSQYWGQAAPSHYLDRVAAQLNERILVAWTGPGVFCRTITNADGRRFRDYLRHRLVLGDNYPVQDRLVDTGPLFLGPLLGRAPELTDSQEAYIANASPLPEADLLALATVADYARDPARYDPERSWKKAIAELGGRAAPALELLARESAASWVADPPPPWLAAGSIAALAAAGDEKGLASLLKDARAMPKSLKASLSPALWAELAPWAEGLARQAAGETGAGLWFSQGALARRALRADPLPLSERLRAFDAAPEPAREALAKLAACAPLFRHAEGQWIGGLAPWFHILGMSANRALAYAGDAPPKAFLPDAIWRWRLRLRLLPLWTSRALIERHLDLVEAGWNPALRPAKVDRVLTIWLWAEGFVRPGSFPNTLSKALARYRQTGDAGQLAGLFRFLEGVPEAARLEAGPLMVPELEPWLEKVREYGELGRRSLELDSLVRAGKPVPEADKQAWAKARERLRSANGLELAVKLKLWLDAFVAWRRLPPAQRPKPLTADWPADPSQVL